MSDDLIYRHAVTEDGEPVPVVEEHGPVSNRINGPIPFGTRPTRPCSWALILPGDTVRTTTSTGITDVVESVCGGDIEVLVNTADESFIGNFAPEDLTLVCGEPSELRRQNPAWRWD